MEQLAGKVLLQRTNPVTPTASGQSVLRIARQSEFLQLELERELMGEGGFQTVSIAFERRFFSNVVFGSYTHARSGGRNFL